MRQWSLSGIKAKQAKTYAEDPMKPNVKKPTDAKTNDTTDNMRAEYDMGKLLAAGVTGKYAKQYREGTNMVLIEPEIHSQFPTAKDVNDALRLVIQLRRIGRPRRTASR